MKAFYVYMMTKQSRVVLYTGITNSLMQRVWQHQNSEIEGFTKTYRVNRLVYYECFDDPRDAIPLKRRTRVGAVRRRMHWSKRRIRSGRILSPMLFQHFKPSSRASAGTGERQ